MADKNGIVVNTKIPSLLELFEDKFQWVANHALVGALQNY